MDDNVTDGDGTPDCLDGCPEDPGFSAPGPCGCPTGGADAGVACTDWCGVDGICDEAALCGDPSTCAPTGGTCTFESYGNMTGPGYWLCTDPLTPAAAQARCADIGGGLVTIRDAEENAFLAALTTTSTAMGGSDAAKEGDWKWSNGVTFYDGAVVQGVYSNWNDGEPNDSSGEDCGFILANGTWNDAKCSNTTPHWCKL